MASTALHIAAVDAAMLACAIASAVSAFHEPRRVVVPRWRLLLPGALATLADAILISFPEYRDLFQLELWTVNSAAILAGVARGALMRMFTDHNLGLVRVRRTYDGIVVSVLLVGFATAQTWIEVRTGTENHNEALLEFLMTLAAGYLFGRSIASWFRAGRIQHDDLDRWM